MRDDENLTERRRFPAIAWGVVALACGLVLVLILVRSLGID